MYIFSGEPKPPAEASTKLRLEASIRDKVQRAPDYRLYHSRG
ncbi:MAG TPA: hypothetical protein PKC30_08635 [Saprospiraceae bacterium]|nr:hypothetical protein [Saprospiraceae bacterium]